MAAGSTGDPKLAELASLIEEIRTRVRERHPAPGGDVRVPDLLPIVHARDAAYAKVAAIGKVNPRRGGLANSLIQGVKKLVSRALHWHVREQVEFNRAVMASLEAVLGALDENNRTLREIHARIPDIKPLERELDDTNRHWAAWRGEWERKLAANEVQFLRGLADLQTAFHHRATLMEGNYRDLVRSQHDDFTGALDRSSIEIQKKLWADLERIRLEYEAIIHHELRMVRQRAALAAPPTAPSPPPAAELPRIDFLKFAEKFRGTEEYVQQGQRFYADRFRDCRNVVDLGCGRGEFLSLLKAEGIPARGIEQSEELVALCRAKGLDATRADLFAYLDSVPELSLDGLFCSQVVEHLAPAAVPELIRLAWAKLAPGGVLAIETPNPECLAIFATHFFLDPTHTRPLPPALLAFYFEEAGFGQIETHRFAPAVESMPALASLPEEFRSAFFGSLDYAVVAKRLR